MRVFFLGMVGLVGRWRNNHRGGWRRGCRNRRCGLDLGRLLGGKGRGRSFRRLALGLNSGTGCFLRFALGFCLNGGLACVLRCAQLVCLALTLGFQINWIALDVCLFLAHFDIDSFAAGNPQGAHCLALEGYLARLAGGLSAV